LSKKGHLAFSETGRDYRKRTKRKKGNRFAPKRNEIGGRDVAEGEKRENQVVRLRWGWSRGVPRAHPEDKKLGVWTNLHYEGKRVVDG